MKKTINTMFEELAAKKSARLSGKLPAPSEENIRNQQEYVRRLKAPPKKVSMLSAYRVLLTDLKAQKTNHPNGYQVTNEVKDAIRGFLKVLINREKWPLIVGNLGTGKSMLAQAMCRFSGKFSNLPTFIMISTHDVVSNYNDKGEEYLQSLQSKNIMFDDLGAELVSFHYQKEDLFIRLIQLRYNARNRVLTGFTSNSTRNQLFERYGERSMERIDEMAVVLPLGADAKAVNYRK